VQVRQFHGKLDVISQRTSFKGDKTEFHWNCRGNAVLAIATEEVDTSNKSYYGVSNVYLLSKTGDNSQVALEKQGPVHALQWSPTGTQFAVCYGYMPAKVILEVFQLYLCF
jgi:translation initiation factor 2A